uniref:50S ribosomal protein L33 n=2 Tax=Babesia bovis TaxID=5865 RepID=A7AW07_BABBO|eukprot:XP_001608803.1 hypothetical protein [Babesia bovis T2Bo]
MALRKYDPRVNRHVVFYQTSIAGNKTKSTPPSQHSIKYARFTGKSTNMKPLIARIQRAYDYGRFNPFDKIYNRLVNTRGAVENRMG